MIDVRAQLKGTGRCIVGPSDDIVEVIFRSDCGTTEGCGRYLGNFGISLGDNERGRRWVSFDNLRLINWTPGTQYRNNYTEHYQPSQYDLEHPEWFFPEMRGWWPNETHPMKCVAYLLSLEDVRSKDFDQLFDRLCRTR